jgi:hypothetical protein
MSDLLSLFRGDKPTGTTPKTTQTRPSVDTPPEPERRGSIPNISNGTAYEVVVPVPSPVIQQPSPSSFHIPGSGGFNGPTDTTGYYFFEGNVTSGDPPPAPPAYLPAEFFVLEQTTTEKVTEDVPLSEQLLQLFTRGPIP